MSLGSSPVWFRAAKSSSAAERERSAVEPPDQLAEHRVRADRAVADGGARLRGQRLIAHRLRDGREARELIGPDGREVVRQASHVAQELCDRDPLLPPHAELRNDLGHRRGQRDLAPVDALEDGGGCEGLRDREEHEDVARRRGATARALREAACLVQGDPTAPRDDALQPVFVEPRTLRSHPAPPVGGSAKMSRPSSRVAHSGHLRSATWPGEPRTSGTGFQPSAPSADTAM